MRPTRRRFLTGAALSTTLIGVSGCLEAAELGPSRGGPRIMFSGNVDADEPLVVDADLSTTDSYPHHYARLVTSKEAEREAIRWEYIERELPGLVDDLEGTHFDSEFLVFVGMVLPRTKQLQPAGTRIEDGTLHAEYHVDPDGPGSAPLVVNTAIKRVVADDPPEDVEVSVRL